MFTFVMENMSTFVIIVASLVLTFVLFPFTANALAKLGWFYTTLESGDIKFIMRGETLYRIIHDLPKGKKLLSKGEEVVFQKNWFNQHFGLYWIGIPPFGRIHEFPIIKERENRDGKNAQEWISRDPEKTMVSSLRSIFPRPFVLKEVELADRTPLDALLTTKLEVADAHTAVFLFKGKFNENAEGIISAEVTDEFRKYPLDDFITGVDKGEIDGILQRMKEPEDEDALDPKKGEFNRALIKQTGLRLVGISISKYDPHDDSGELRKAMNAQIIAQEEAKAVEAKAEGYRKGKLIEADADAQAEIMMANARGTRVKATREALAGDEAAAKVLQAEALPNLTTLVEGHGKAKIVIPTGGGK